MKISNIKYFSTVNGTGVRTTVFVSGCNIHCKGCFNKEAWNFDKGHEMTDALIEKILKSIEPEYIDGLSILGGEPLDRKNQEGVCKLILKFRHKFGDTKNIWLWTGYTYKNIPITQFTEPILRLTDVLVDGSFDINLKDINLKYRGSSNQRIIDLNNSYDDHIVLLENA